MGEGEGRGRVSVVCMCFMLFVHIPDPLCRRMEATLCLCHLTMAL